jgi:aspartyl/asparaginyl beta-hydroxylase (cupin superfamily)
LGAGPDYMAALLGFERNGWTPSWQVGSSNPNFAWLTYAIKAGSWSHPDSATRCPQTMRLVDNPVYDVVAFSLFHGLSILGPHAHPELDEHHPVVHLGIDVEPRKSFLVVDGTHLEEREGELVTFNGTHEHYAFNISLRDRIILYLELDLTKV